MTIREFFESKEKLAIHCDTEEKAIALLEAFDKAGYRWKNGDRYTDETCWYDYTKDTCYDNRGLYCDREWLQRTGFRIIEFEEIELEEIEDIEHPKYIEVIQECIRLLSVDGSNTKQQVKELLERLVDNGTD